MTEKRDWSQARDWSAPTYTQAVSDAQQLEALMRNILKLFADGCLVYRDRPERTTRCGLQTKSERLRRLRSAASGPAQVA